MNEVYNDGMLSSVFFINDLLDGKMKDKQETYYYEDIIDLREVVKTLWNHKWLIITVTLLAAAAAFVTDKFILPPQYEASAHIGIRRSTFQANLEPSIDAPSSLEDYQQLRDLTGSLPELAEADDVKMSVCNQMGIQCTGEGSVLPELEAELVGTNQLKLTVICENPDRAAEFANAWAVEVISRWNELYGNENVDLSQLEGDVETARRRWSEAQGALEAYLPESKINVVQVQLSQAKNKLNSYLDEIHGNERLMRDASSLDSRLENLDQTRSLPAGEALSLLTLQEKIGGDAGAAQFLLPGLDLSNVGYTVRETRDSLTALIQAYEAQNEVLTEKISGVEDEITALSVELEEEQYKIDRLKQERDRVRQEYSALAGYLDESRINQQNQKQAAYSIARAIVPKGESGLSTIVIVALTGIVAGMIATSGVFVYSWWTEDEESE